MRSVTYLHDFTFTPLKDLRASLARNCLIYTSENNTCIIAIIGVNHIKFRTVCNANFIVDGSL